MFREALVLNLETGNLNWVAINYQNMALAFNDLGQHDSAVVNYIKALEVSDGIGNVLHLAHLYAMANVIYSAEEEQEKSLSLE